MNHLPEIHIKVITHGKQRYNTCGDYFKKGKRVQVYLSKTEPDYEFLVAIHELLEWYLTQKRGITIKQIDKFDMGNPELADPGSSKQAPYYKEHSFATDIERIIAKELSVDWDRYDLYIEKL